MNWDAVGAVGEVAGSILVMVSVIYLAVQLRQANMHAEASAEVAWMEGWNRVLEGWVADPRTMQALRSGFGDFNRLEKDQQAVFQMRVGALANHWILARQLSQKKLIARDIAETATEVMVSIFSTPGGLQYWERDADATPFGPELLARARARDGVLAPFTELFPWWSDTPVPSTAMSSEDHELSQPG